MHLPLLVPLTSLIRSNHPLFVLLRSHFKYAYSILAADPVAHSCSGLLYHSRGLPTLLLTTVSLLFYCLLLHTTLPSSSSSLALLRLASVPLFIAVLFPMTFHSASFTLGNDFRDIAIPSLTWLPIAEILKLGLVSLWDTPQQRAPRWIVPKSQAHKWKGAVCMPLPWDKTASDEVTSTSPASSTPTLVVPTVWYVVPHPPPWSRRRMLWALDNLAIRRPGTSWIFPQEQRALEWALPKLVATGEIYRDAARLEQQQPSQDDGFSSGKQIVGIAEITPKAEAPSVIASALSSRRKLAEARRREAPIWFGQKEQGIVGSLVQLAVLYAFQKYVRFLSLPLHPGPTSDQSFFNVVSLWDQYILTFGLGMLVAFTAAPGELVLNSILLHLLKFPITAVAPSFQRPLNATGPRDFWGTRWHQWLRRDFSALARLVPGARTYPAIAALGAFSISAAEHSLVFGRFKPTPPTAWHVPTLVFLTIPIHFFFLCQAALLFLEENLLGPYRTQESLIKKSIRRALLWFGLLTSGRYITAYLYQLGVFYPVEFFNWSSAITLPGELWEELTASK